MAAGAQLRGLARRVIPDRALRQLDLVRARRRFEGASNAEIFGAVYSGASWGDGDDGFSSGPGSHDEATIAPYVAALSQLIRALDGPVDVVDLGCGDFNVGRQLRPLCAGYVAADVVPDLIERNRRAYAGLDVDFRVVDLVTDPLPAGRVATIRQVLQHLSNDAVHTVLDKLGRFEVVVVTDHQPAGGFTANLDIPTGPHTRLKLDSALDLTAAPFRLDCVEARELCVLPWTGPEGGVLRTTAFVLQVAG